MIASLQKRTGGRTALAGLSSPTTIFSAKIKGSFGPTLGSFLPGNATVVDSVIGHASRSNLRKTGSPIETGPLTFRLAKELLRLTA